MPLFIKKIIYPVRGRKIYYLSLDVLIIIASLGLSYVIRFYPELGNYLQFLPLSYFYIMVPSFILMYYLFQLYRIMWAYSNVADFYRLVAANISGFFLFISILLFLHIPYSRLVVILSFMLISIVSVFYRILIRDYFTRKSRGRRQSLFGEDRENRDKKIIMIGAGEAGRTILSEYHKMGLDSLIVGFADDDPDKVGKMFGGKRIYCTTKDINNYIYDLGINEVLIAMPSVEVEVINRIVSIVRRENPAISIRILPSFMELFDDKPLTTYIRDISLNDLIGREEFKIDRLKMRERFGGKTILITGAGGSIGSEICRQLLKFDVKKLIAIGRGEFSIYTLIKSLNENIELMDKRPEIIYRIIDIKDYRLLEKAFADHRPDVVFHAAAHKHVPLMEYNEIEAVQNNVGGTVNLLDLSLKYRVEEFVLISTDKAVNPVSIMGATKRIAELAVDYYNREKGLKTSIVRFGNVIGSRGSVVPLFREQIENGGPVTITHPEITRYFMSIPEASLLVINAAAYSQGGEMYVLDMGSQYRVLDIAKRLIRLYGYEPDEDIKIKYSGLRPGEKMYEELYYDKEKLQETGNEKIFVLTPGSGNYDGSSIEKFFSESLPDILNCSPANLRTMLKKIVPEYDFDHKHDPDNFSNKFVS